MNQHSQHPGRRRDLETSLTKLTEDNKYVRNEIHRDISMCTCIVAYMTRECNFKALNCINILIWVYATMLALCPMPSAPLSTALEIYSLSTIDNATPTRHLYEGLKGLRQRRSSMSPPESAETGRAHSELPISPEQTMKIQNSFMHGRVQLLREHNQKLEDYIGRLKLTASMVRLLCKHVSQVVSKSTHYLCVYLNI